MESSENVCFSRPSLYFKINHWQNVQYLYSMLKIYILSAINEICNRRTFRLRSDFLLPLPMKATEGLMITAPWGGGQFRKGPTSLADRLPIEVGWLKAQSRQCQRELVTMQQTAWGPQRRRAQSGCNSDSATMTLYCSRLSLYLKKGVKRKHPISLWKHNSNGLKWQPGVPSSNGNESKQLEWCFRNKEKGEHRDENSLLFWTA